MFYVGIDPGCNEAGVGILWSTGVYFKHYRLSDWEPYHFKNIMEDLSLVTKINSSSQDEGILVAIEKVGVMPGQGISSTGKFMKATGIMIGILVGLNIPFFEVTPQKWRKLSPTLAPQKGESAMDKKNKSLVYIQNRYPVANLKKKIEHNVADALCIAEWLYLREKGN